MTLSGKIEDGTCNKPFNFGSDPWPWRFVLSEQRYALPLNASSFNYENGVLRKLKHIFPNTYQRIKSIRSPAKVGLVVTDLITSPVVSWEGWETPPPQHRGSAVILCMTSSGGQRGGRRAIIFILW